jgi:hypothetical protein
MSDASESVSKALEALQASREQTGSLLVTNEELLYRRVVRFCRLPNMTDIHAEELLDVLGAAYFRSGGQPVPAVLLDAIEAKLEEARAASGAAQKNRGGHPGKFDWRPFAREIIRIANTPDGLPERAALQRIMMDWCHAQWGDDAPAENTVRGMIAELYPS